MDNIAIKEMLDLNKLKMVFGMLSKNDKVILLKLLYKHRNEMGINETQLIVLSKVKGMNMSNLVSDIIRQNLAQYEPKQIEDGVSEALKHLDEEDKEDILKLNCIPQDIKDIIMRMI